MYHLRHKICISSVEQVYGLPNGKFIRWNHNGQSYIGDSNNNLSQFANYAEISTINNKINQITGDMQLLTSRVEPYQSDLLTYTLTLPQNIFYYEYIYLYFQNMKIYSKSCHITPFNVIIAGQSQEYAQNMLIHLIKPNLCIVAASTIYGYDDSDEHIQIQTFPTNTNIVTLQGYNCNIQIYGKIA